MALAKPLHLPIFIIGHVTKDGSLAGPRVLEHMVDTVLYFEGNGTYLPRTAGCEELFRPDERDRRV